MPVLQSEVHDESEEKAEELLEEHVDENNGDMITQEEIDVLLMGGSGQKHPIIEMVILRLIMLNGVI